MKKISLALIILIVVGICIPAVSAETIELSKDHSIYDNYAPTSDGIGSPIGTYLAFHDITIAPDLDFVYGKSSLNSESSGLWATLRTTPSNSERFKIEESGEIIAAGDVYYNTFFNADNEPIAIQFWFEFDYWNLNGRSGKKITRIIPEANTVLFSLYMKPQYTASTTVSADLPVMIAKTSSGTQAYTCANYIIYGSMVYTSQIEVSDTDLTIYRDNYTSTCVVKTGSETLTDTGNKDRTFKLVGAGNWTVTNSWGDIFSGDFGSPDTGDPDSTTVTVYVKNSQTYALIANAHILISANVDGNFYEVANETVPSGIYYIDLQPTGGGLPNPDFYRLIVTAEGYTSIMPYMDFEVKGATRIYEFMEPTGGAPENENNTFIDFYVRDMSANPISGATVNFGGYTLITNSAGYTIFEVDKSKTYSWTVSKSGYGSLTGNVVIGDDPRHTINTVLAPAVTPTTPTAIPTSTPISPTPTMTAPTGEPVSNWLEWFASHFGMILGGGAEIGKIFMWLCFSVPVGVYVGKEAKAGAAGFLAGAGVVTLFFVLIGWVPIWLLVLLALIIGLLYAKVFNNSDNGGGR